MGEVRAARIRVRYFASVREALGPEEWVEARAGATVGALRDQLAARSPLHLQNLGRPQALRCAWNHALCDESLRIDGDGELAFFPPVTGG